MAGLPDHTARIDPSAEPYQIWRIPVVQGSAVG